MNEWNPYLLLGWLIGIFMLFLIYAARSWLRGRKP